MGRHDWSAADEAKHPRDAEGRFASTGTSFAHALEDQLSAHMREAAPPTPDPKADKLKLAGRIDLEHGEALVASAKVDGAVGGARFALTSRNGQPDLRIGFGPEGYGNRDRENGIPAWDGNASARELTKADRDRLNAEDEALGMEWDSASPARQAEIEARQDAIREELSVGAGEFNGTTRIGPYAIDRLVTVLRPALAEAVEQHKAESAAWDEIERLEATGHPDPGRLAELRRIARADSPDALYFAEGILPGDAWGDIHYEVYLDDGVIGPEVVLGVSPKGAPDNWVDVHDWRGHFDPAEAHKVLKALEQMREHIPSWAEQVSNSIGHH